jgi:hypothetical protein
LRAGTAHVGGGSEDNGIGLIERLPAFFGDGIYFYEFNLGAGETSPLGNVFSNAGGVSITRMIGNRDV